MTVISVTERHTQSMAYLDARACLLARSCKRPVRTLPATRAYLLQRRGSKRHRTCAGGFSFRCADGIVGVASKILLATGIVDEVPELPGIETLYGVSVHHCLYCDGFEYRGKSVAAYGKGDKGAELALAMKHWIADIVACSDGTEVSPHAVLRLQHHGIPLRSEPIKFLEGAEGVLRKIKFEAGQDLDRVGLFFSTGCHQASDLSERLEGGCVGFRSLTKPEFLLQCVDKLRSFSFGKRVVEQARIMGLLGKRFQIRRLGSGHRVIGRHPILCVFTALSV